ncbi:MAG: hypothetical protein H0X24_00305 [Ktedonobacterales bacterium]|nr:hypothetical protein [Ktedonobacterales bacterium]
MAETQIWVLKDRRFRWVQVIPRVISAEAEERLRRSRLFHISLTDVSPSMPVCGTYRASEYHPWPLATRTIDDTDACGACITAVKRANPDAFFVSNQMLFVHGSVEIFPGAPTLPPAIIDQMTQMAALIGQQQQHIMQQGAQLQRLLGAWTQSLLAAGITAPQELLALAAPATAVPHVETLATYQQYRDWCQTHSDPACIVRITGTEAIIHFRSCDTVKNQTAATYTPRWGVLTEDMADDCFPDAEGCHICHTQTPRHRRISTPTTQDESLVMP